MILSSWMKLVRIPVKKGEIKVVMQEIRNEAIDMKDQVHVEVPTILHLPTNRGQIETREKVEVHAVEPEAEEIMINQKMGVIKVLSLVVMLSPLLLRVKNHPSHRNT